MWSLSGYGIDRLKGLVSTAKSLILPEYQKKLIYLENWLFKKARAQWNILDAGHDIKFPKNYDNKYKEMSKIYSDAVVKNNTFIPLLEDNEKSKYVLS